MSRKIETFEQMKLNKSLQKALRENGFETPTPIQEATFKPIRSGSDIIGIAQTGTGKTFAYLLPILDRLHYAQGSMPRALIVVPTRELVQQVVEAAELFTTYTDLRVLGIYGGTNIRTQSDRVAEGIDLLVTTPGRCMDIYFTRVLRLGAVKTLVIDEADRLMDLGFIPQLETIFEALPVPQTLMFTATFSAEIAQLSEQFLRSPKRLEVSPQASTVADIELMQYVVPNFYTKVNLLKLLMQDEALKKVMVFVNSKKKADLLSQLLGDLEDELGVIHSNKAQNTRFSTLLAFKEGKTRMLISSDIGARGIDIEDISHVINFELPLIKEEFVHRVGRTGRAQQKGIAISFVVEEDDDEIRDEIEGLIKREIATIPLPEMLEISEDLLEEERVITKNIRYKSAVVKGGGAFHQKKKKGNKKLQQRSKKIKRGKK